MLLAFWAKNMHSLIGFVHKRLSFSSKSLLILKKKRSFAPDFNGKDGKREKFTPYYIYKISCRYYKQKY